MPGAATAVDRQDRPGAGAGEHEVDLGPVVQSLPGPAALEQDTDTSPFGADEDEVAVLAADGAEAAESPSPGDVQAQQAGG